MEQDCTAMPAVSPGVIDIFNLKGAETPVASGAGLYTEPGGMSRGAANKFFLAGEFKLHRPTGNHRGEPPDVFGQEFLLTAEPATDAFAKDSYRTLRQTEQVGKFAPGREWGLRAGAHVETIVPIQPGYRAVGLERRMLSALCRILGFVHEIGAGKAPLDI